MENELVVLYVTAASLGFIHTIVGPDHYLPFIVMGRARKWPTFKTLLVTLGCGVGHIIGSMVLGLVGIVFGVGVMKLEALEAVRGNIAAWALIGFGLAYLMWGIRRAVRYKPHHHEHDHRDEDEHTHKHIHVGSHSHIHKTAKSNITPWILFTIFVLGPCEPLIPILMYPAAKNSVVGALVVSGVFGIVTIVTMLAMVFALSAGLKIIPLGRLEKYSHALAGGAILLSGLAIHLLSL